MLESTGIHNLNIELKNKCIIISGKKDLLIPVNFSVTLKPVRTEGRTLFFDVIRFSPDVWGIIQSIVFNQLPKISYNNGQVGIDLNDFEKISRFPLGNIRSLEVKDDSLWIQIGM